MRECDEPDVNRVGGFKRLRMRALKQQFLVDEAGRKTAVILPVRRYKKLLEDLHDLAVVAERREEEAISLQEMKRRLKAHGVL